MRYRLIIFDFDGTLADSLGWVRSVFNEFAERHGFRALAQDEMETMRGWDNRTIVRHLGVPMWKMPAIAADMRRCMARNADRISLFPGAAELLRRLSGDGVMLAIVTSNSEENVRRILGPEAASLIAIYECGASIFGKRAKFRRALKRSGVPRREALCVGDEVRDIEAAREAGIAAAAVTWGYASPELLRAHAPTALFASFEQIANAAPARVA